MNCAHCPLAGRDCPAFTRPHRRYCELVDPSHPDYTPEYVGVLADGPPQPPPLLTRVVNFAGAVVSHVSAGLPTLDAGSVAARLAVCGGCPKFSTPNACSVCGCNLAVKASWADQHCPESRWPGDPRENAP